MSLINCKECNEKISNKAKACPKCGFKNKNVSPITSLFMIGMAFYGVYLFYIAATPSTTVAPTTAQSTSAPTIDTSAEAQQRRETLLGQLVDRGIFYKHEITGTLPRVYVAPAFHTLNIDDKKAFISVAHAYYIAAGNTDNLTVIFDSLTGKQIGTFNEFGLQME